MHLKQICGVGNKLIIWLQTHHTVSLVRYASSVYLLGSSWGIAKLVCFHATTILLLTYSWIGTSVTSWTLPVEHCVITWCYLHWANVNSTRWWVMMRCSWRHAKIFVWIYLGCNVSCQVSADKWLAYSTEWQLMTPSNCLEGLGLRLLSSPHLWPKARIRGWMTLTKNFGPDLLLLWSVDSQGNY